VIVTVKVPKVGDSTARVLVVDWLVAAGEHVDAGADMVVIETDKTELAVPSPLSGRVVEILAAPESEIDVGAPLCRLDTGDGTQ